LTNDVMEVSSLVPFCLQLTRSATCCGLIPSGPPLDPAGNERIAFIMSASDIWSEGVEAVPGITRGMLPPQAETGCFSVSFAKVSLLSGAGLSSEHMILNAALIFPSSIFDVTAAAMEELPSKRFLGIASVS